MRARLSTSRAALAALVIALPLAAGLARAQAPAVTAPNPNTANAPAAAPATTAAPAAAPAPVAAPAPAPTVALGTIPSPRTAPMPAAAPAGSLLQTLFALILVLAVLGALAWFLKRYGPRAGGASANIKIVGSLSLGGRERLLVVEIGNQWIVVGAAPGRVNGLATLPRQEGVDAGAALSVQGPAAHNFADWLKQTIDKRKHGK